MPRVPQILSSGEVGGAGLVRASPALADMSGIQQAMGTLGQAAQTFARVDKAVTDENAKLEAELALGELQRQAADAEIALQQDLSVTPENYAKRNDENLRAIQQGVGKSIQSPQGRQLFERRASQFMTQKSIKGKWDGVELGIAHAKSKTDILLGHDETVATFGETEAIRAEGEDRLVNRIKEAVQKRIYSGTEAASRLTQHRANIDAGQARLQAMDPEQRSKLMMDLLEGRRPYMGGKAQLDMFDKLMKDAETRQTKADQEAKRMADEAKERDMTAWTQDALKPDMRPSDMIARLDSLVKTHHIKDTEYQRMYATLTRPEKEVESDGPTLRRVIADTHSMQPKMSEADLNGLFDRHLLNRKDWITALNRRRETLESNRREGHSLVMQQHAQAEQELLKHAGVVTPFSQLDAVQEKLVPEVLTELRRRSSAYPGGKESPLKVTEELIPRIRGTLSRDAQFSRAELEKQMKYLDKAELEKARREGKITEGFFTSERDRQLRRDALIKREQENAEKKAQEQKTQPPGRLR